MGMVSIIVAVAENGVIGKKNALPWYLPADLKRFKEMTTGKPIIMGRTTYESIGKPLPDRLNIVLSSDMNLKIAGCVVVYSVEEALGAARDFPEVMVIGGASIYRQFLPLARRMYLTRVRHNAEGDIYFPKFNQNEWQEISRDDFKADDKNPYDYSFLTLERKS